MAALYLLLSGDTREPAAHTTSTHSTSAENNSAHVTKESH
jgi:aspartate carbamoyltransferase catalytic subunit